MRKDLELKAKMREARLVSDIASLEERVKEAEKVQSNFRGGPAFCEQGRQFHVCDEWAHAGWVHNTILINEVLPATGNNFPTN